MVTNTRHLLKVGFFANVLEWYEFSIYAYLAATMGQLFLTATQPIAALIQAYALFAISYLARPLGSFFWGYLGDRVGRSYSLKYSLLMASIPTAFIGMLPTYPQIGFWAPVSLILLRFIQGFAFGGELPVTGCYVYESSPSQYRGVFCSIFIAGQVFGILLGSLVVTLLSWYFDPTTILSGAWRIPYLLSIPITIWIAYVRRSLTLTEPTYSSYTGPVGQKKDLLGLNLTMIKSKLLPLIMLGAFLEVCFYGFFIWLPAYLTYFLHLSPQIAQLCNLFALIAFASLGLLSAYIANFLGYSRLLLFHISAIILLIYPLLQALQSTTYTVLFMIHLVLAWLLSGISGVIIQIQGDSFPKEIRCSGMSLAITISASIFGGTTPLICTYFTNKTGILMFPAFYIMFFGLLALPVAYLYLSDKSSYGQLASRDLNF